MKKNLGAPNKFSNEALEAPKSLATLGEGADPSVKTILGPIWGWIWAPRLEPKSNQYEQKEILGGLNKGLN